MPSVVSSRRVAAGVSRRAKPARTKGAPATRARPPSPRMSWPAIAMLGGVVTAIASWIFCAGVTVLGWLPADSGNLGGALVLGTRLWLLGNGIGVRVGAIPVTLVPWGVTALIAFMIWRFATASARRARAEHTTSPALTSVVTVAAYLLPVLLVTLLLGEPWQVAARWAAVMVVFLLAAVSGSRRVFGVGRAVTRRWTIARAVVSAQLVMLVVGAAVLVTGLASHLKRVQALHEALEPGISGAIALLLLQLAFAPNALIWSASYALGSGFSLGTGSLVAPAGTQLGILPGIPILGALPSAGPGDLVQLWWLAAGALAGATACWVALADRSDLGLDQAILRGGACGLLAGVVFAGLAWATSGDLGTLRLADLGPRLLELLVMAGTTMGLSGMIAGLGLSLVRKPGR
jgi:Family of unknown function (DUF6350)